MKDLRKQKGITLIALVITIIVLLILAGISISALTGENGILSKSKKAKLETSHGAVKEAVITAYNEYILELEEKKEMMADEYNNRYDGSLDYKKFTGDSNVKLKKLYDNGNYIPMQIYSSTFLSYCEYKQYLDEYIKDENISLPDEEIEFNSEGLINVPKLVGHDTGYGKGKYSDGYVLLEKIELERDKALRPAAFHNNSNLNKIVLMSNKYNVMKTTVEYIRPYQEVTINYMWRLYYVDKKGNIELLHEVSDIIDVPLMILE